MPSTPDDEFTELVDADIPRVDLVDKAANGTRFLIAKSGAGMMAPDLIRELIGKGAEEQSPAEALTPAQKMARVHEASVRKAARYALLAEAYGWTPEQVDELHPAMQESALVYAELNKADLLTASVNDLPDAAFAHIEPGGHKDASGKTTPRSLRHFPVHDAAHVRNALSRAPQSPFGSKAMPKIRAAAAKFGIEVSKSVDLDATTVLAEPDGKVPGSPDEPGSAAWEAVDAASARKWTALLVRARNALCSLADREGAEAATADPDDLGRALDLKDAAAAVDYAVGVLARFAVDEQAEADMADDDAVAVGKAAAAVDLADLETLEALAPLAKAGRVLSAGNETAIRNAVAALQQVLASLPQPIPDDGQPVAKNKETAMTAVTDIPADAETAAVAKADTAQVLVYTADGRPFATVAPDALMAITQPEAPEGSDGDGMDEIAESAPQIADGEDAAVIPGTQTIAAPAPAAPEETMAKNADKTTADKAKKIKKSKHDARLAKALGEVIAPLTEELAQYAQLDGVVKGLQEQMAKLGGQPDDRNSPLLNGAGIPVADGTAQIAVPDGLDDLRKAVADAKTPVEKKEAEQQLAWAAIKATFTR